MGNAPAACSDLDGQIEHANFTSDKNPAVVNKAFASDDLNRPVPILRGREMEPMESRRRVGSQQIQRKVEAEPSRRSRAISTPATRNEPSVPVSRSPFNPFRNLGRSKPKAVASSGRQGGQVASSAPSGGAQVETNPFRIKNTDRDYEISAKVTVRSMSDRKRAAMVKEATAGDLSTTKLQSQFDLTESQAKSIFRFFVNNPNLIQQAHLAGPQKTEKPTSSSSYTPSKEETNPFAAAKADLPVWQGDENAPSTPTARTQEAEKFEAGFSSPNLPKASRRSIDRARGSYEAPSENDTPEKDFEEPADAIFDEDEEEEVPKQRGRTKSTNPFRLDADEDEPDREPADPSIPASQLAARTLAKEERTKPKPSSGSAVEHPWESAYTEKPKAAVMDYDAIFSEPVKDAYDSWAPNDADGDADALDPFPEYRGGKADSGGKNDGISDETYGAFLGDGVFSVTRKKKVTADDKFDPFQ